MKIKCDLHIHSCLSPCASLEMGPKDIIEKSLEQGLNLIAISDHNSALNCNALNKLSKNIDIICLYGIEATSSEEAHILFVFEKYKTAQEFSDYLFENLPDYKNVPNMLGDQIVVDEENNIENEVDKYLGNAVNLTLDELIDEGKKREAIIIPSHIDKPVFSIISQLGFLPDLPYDAIEVFQSDTSIQTGKFPIVSNSDAHYLDDIGKKYFEVELESYSFNNFKYALRNNNISLHYN